MRFTFSPLVLGLALALGPACASGKVESRAKNKDDKEKKDGGETEGDDAGKTEGGELPGNVCTEGKACEDGNGEAGDADATDAGEEPADPIADFSITGPGAKTNSQPDVTWEAATGAEKYDVTIASDDECKDAVYEEKGVTETKLALSELEPGDIFICVTAIKGDFKKKAKNDALQVEVRKGWVKISATNGPPPGRCASAFFDGKEVFVYGGIDGTTVYQPKMKAYDPEADKWREVEEKAPKPTTRSFTRMAWTGTAAFLFGGATMTAAFTEGRLFDPKGGEWKEATATDEPSARAFHSLVWAGDKALVYGGSNSALTALYSTGYSYSPKDDKWELLAASNSPGNLTRHCAVWTGTEMLLWGGGHTTTTTNAHGFAFNPTTEEWRSFSGTGEPSLRNQMACVWSGKTMIMFGGGTSHNTPAGSALANGGIYDPGADSWSTLPTSGGPSARFCTAHAWAGDAMFVWGGTSGGNVNAPDGYLYYP